jgi:hypothetical protein
MIITLLWQVQSPKKRDMKSLFKINISLPLLYQSLTKIWNLEKAVAVQALTSLNSREVKRKRKMKHRCHPSLINQHLFAHQLSKPQLGPLHSWLEEAGVCLLHLGPMEYLQGHLVRDHLYSLLLLVLKKDRILLLNNNLSNQKKHSRFLKTKEKRHHLAFFNKSLNKLKRKKYPKLH